MIEALLSKEKAISVTGLGYVGLPLALALSAHFQVIGYDRHPDRIALMRQGRDPSDELQGDILAGRDILFTDDPAALRQAHFHIIAVPTPVNEHWAPELEPLLSASRAVGAALKPGDFVVYESTVYPGCTEEDCLPVLLEVSGLEAGQIHLAYSPERINPGDKLRTLDQIVKVVSAQDPQTLDTVADVYNRVVKAGIFRAPSIKVAEAAKVVENTQRDLNISFVNELSVIFDRLGIDTQEVLATASTKWNFLPFMPGLVGGHCISVDPYYLLHKSRQAGYDPQVILSGRRVNDQMPAFIAKRLIQMLTQQEKSLKGTKVLVMGVTFKENVSDIRNSKVVDLIRELSDYLMTVHVCDPRAHAREVSQEYGLELKFSPDDDYDAVIVAVGHDAYRELDMPYFASITRKPFIIMDLKGLYPKPSPPTPDFLYWRL
jgi:UDP-N-acetyl-D-galactosamine dehydrogenase